MENPNESGSKNVEINTGDLGAGKEVELDRTGVNEVNEEEDNTLNTGPEESEENEDDDESSSKGQALKPESFKKDSGQVDSYGAGI